MLFRIKKRRDYHSPRVVTSEVDPMSALCASVRFNIQVDPLENMNDITNPEADVNGEKFYFES